MRARIEAANKALDKAKALADTGKKGSESLVADDRPIFKGITNYLMKEHTNIIQLI